MRTGRLDAFSDGVLAVVITIMVLELEAPEGHTPDSLRPVVGGFGTYALSLLYIGIYWNNHHHLFQTVDQVSGAVLWANLHLLFWLSLLPFSTAWMDDSSFARTPVVLYGLDLLPAAIAFYLLQLAIFRTGSGERLRQALGRNLKGTLSPLIYVTGIGLAFVAPWLGVAMFITSVLVWLVPDRRVERYLAAHPDPLP